VHLAHVSSYRACPNFLFTYCACHLSRLTLQKIFAFASKSQCHYPRWFETIIAFICKAFISRPNFPSSEKAVQQYDQCTITAGYNTIVDNKSLIITKVVCLFLYAFASFKFFYSSLILLHPNIEIAFSYSRPVGFIQLQE
jgi:hypothetical protein